MYVIVHRGTAQIGGNLIEIGTAQTRLLFDAGVNLPPINDPKVKDNFKLEGLTCGKPAFDAVLISHHHNDHCGLLNRVLPSIPVFAGVETARILGVISDFIWKPFYDIRERLYNMREITVNDMKIIPLSVDHSARDAYMFLVRADGKNVLYTGDFRDASHIPAEVKELLGGEKLDLLITEGTNMRASGAKFLDEAGVEKEAARLMEEYDGTVFVLSSSTNQDRVQSIKRAADRTGRMVCADVFQSVVQGEKEDGFQRFVANPITKEKTPGAYSYFEKLYGEGALVGAKSLARILGKKVVFVRTSMLNFMKTYLKYRPKNEKNVLIYSIWKGYKTSSPVKSLFHFCDEKGIDIEELHCSGHASPEEIKSLIDGLAPTAILPIHCENSEREKFNEFHPNCMMVSDGERLEV